MSMAAKKIDSDDDVEFEFVLSEAFRWIVSWTVCYMYRAGMVLAFRKDDALAKGNRQKLGGWVPKQFVA